jgi:phage-related protein
MQDRRRLCDSRRRRCDGGWLLVSAATLDTVGQMSRRGGKKGGGESKASAGLSTRRAVGHRWRDYRTASGRRPIKQFLDRLDDEDLASVIAAMKAVRRQGLKAARHLDGEIYEVRADGKGVIYRILFAPQGKRKQVFLSLEALKKKRQKTPPEAIRLAKRRLRDWQQRGE